MKFLSLSYLLITLDLLVVSASAQTAAVADPPEEPAAIAASAAALPQRITPSDYVLLPRVGRYDRAPLHADPIERAIALGDWTTPAAGDEVLDSEGAPRRWRDENDAPSPADLRGGYAFAEFDSPAAGVMLLEAPGCAAVWINGEWVVGNPYGVSWFRPPVNVVEGSNRLLLHLARPAARARLIRPDNDVSLLASEATLPDALVGDDTPLHASLPLVNATDKPLEDLEIVVEGEDPIALPWIAPRAISPAVFVLPAANASEPGTKTYRITLQQNRRENGGEDVEEQKGDDQMDESPRTLSTAEITLRVVSPDEPHTHTHLSAVDNSVQPYSVLPASESADDEAGVLLLLHDAGVDHTGAIARCERLPGMHVVAPGGRGPFGFDWEDWSADDALEALDDFLRRTPSDKSRVSVTGRGMGGHGALVLAARAPGRFAAVAPVNPWISFYTQGRARPLPADATRSEQALLRRTAASDPLRVLRNLESVGVRIAHETKGAAIDPAECRLLRARLSEFHGDFAYRESAGAGRIAPGSPLVEFCARRATLPIAKGDSIAFATSDLGALDAVGWARIEAQSQQGKVSKVDLRRDTKSRRYTGQTENVDRLAIMLDGLTAGKRISVALDGEPAVRFDWPRRNDVVRLTRDSVGRWRRQRGQNRGALSKDAARPGGLKSVFANRPQLVFGTQGATEEQDWCLAKARYDAMLFYYRGAGRLDLLPDARLDLREDPGRNIVLYGSSHSNRAYRFLMHSSPVWVDEGVVEVGPRPEVGDDLAVTLVRPRWNSRRASVALIGGTGPSGMRLTSRLRYFWSGVAYPDLVVFGPDALGPPSAAPEIDPRFRGDLRTVGEFGGDWTAESGEIVWRDVAM